MNGPMLAIAVVLIALISILLVESRRVPTDGLNGEEKERAARRKQLLERVAAGIAGVAGILLLWSLAAPLAYVWQWIGTSWGVAGLVISAMFTAWGTWHMLVKGNHHHALGTFAVVIGFAFTAGLVIGGWKAFLASGADTLTAAGQQSGRVITGRAATQAVAQAHHAAHSTATLSGWAAAGLAVAFLVLALLYRRSYKADKTRKAAAAITAGPRAGLAPGGAR